MKENVKIIKRGIKLKRRKTGVRYEGNLFITLTRFFFKEMWVIRSVDAV